MSLKSPGTVGVASRGKIQFGDFSLRVTLMLIWMVKCSDANPTVTLNPSSSVYFDVGGSMSLVCEVDQDIGVTRIYFMRNNSVQVSVSPSMCTIFPSILGDPRTYSSICSQGRIFTLKINGVSVADHRTTWSCQVLTSSGTCAAASSVRCGSPDLGIFLRVAVTSLLLTDISGQTLSNPVSVRVGSKTYFKCSTSPNGSRPKATFRWYKKLGSQAPVEIEDQTIISSTSDPIPVPGQPETDLVISNSMLTFVGSKQDQNVYIFCGGRDETNTGDEKLSGMAQLNIVYPPVVSLSPNSSVYNVTKDRQSFVLTCNVVDTNPQPQQNGFQWLYKSVLVPGQTSSSYTIQSVQKSHDGEYKCTASNLYGTGTSQPLYLVVQYGPSIAQLGIKDIEEGDNLSVTCIVSASPPAIVMWTRSGEQTSQSAVLSLPSISRNQEGNYTCTASNVLYPTGLSPDFKQASEMLIVHVLSAPKILDVSPDYKGYVGQFTIVQFNFCSNTKENLTVTARHSNSSGLIHQGIIQLIHLDNLQVNLSQIPVPGFRAALVISITSENDFGQYDIEVTNSIGSDSKSIRIVEQITPEKPLNFLSTNIQEKQLSLMWQSGYDGGFTQTFVIERSLDNITWINVSEVSAGNRDGWFTTVIGDLIPGSEYYFRLYAYNINRRGDFADVQLEVRMLKECACASSLEVGASVGISVGGAVGVGVGGAVLGLIGAIIAFSIRRQLIGPKCSCFRSKGKTDGEMHTYSNDEMNPETVKPVYEELNKGIAERNVYDKISPF